MRELIWRGIARIITTKRVSHWLMNRAAPHPYSHITGPDGSLYMGRWWLFNPYGKAANGEQTPARFPWLPSVRIHWITRPDSDRALHDHPWNARTIILRGGYIEERPVTEQDWARTAYQRERGYTGRLLFGQYHRISHVPEGGAWTLFITWKKRGTWGFLVGGAKVPWRKYLGIEKTEPQSEAAPSAATT